MPIFDGFLLSAQAREARLQALKASEQTQHLTNCVIHEVKIAMVETRSRFERRQLTAAVLDQAGETLALANSQYELGLTSFMELSNAEVQQTEAEIANTNAEYLSRVSKAVLRFQLGTHND